MAEEGVVRLADAARELGCHIETLRERIRGGRLAATRGPHGAYFVSRVALASQPPVRRGRPARYWPALTIAEERHSWLEVERLLAEESADIRIELRLLKVLRENPDFYPDLYRLVTVHRLRAMGWSFDFISEWLEISYRHARRLAKKRLWRSLRYMLAIKRTRLNQKLARKRAQELIDILRQRLQAERVPPWRGRWKRHKLNAYEREALTAAGVTAEELEAIWLEGLTHDEVNHLLLKGSHRSKRQRVAIRTKDELLDPWPKRQRREDVRRLS